MSNTAILDNNLTIILFFAFLLPIPVYFITKMFNEMSVEVNPPVTWNDVQQSALQDAVNGDSAARKWVTEHVFGIHKSKLNKTKSNKPKKLKPVFLTDKKIMLDAVAALTAVKHKKDRAKIVVAKLCKKTKYPDVGSLLLDCFKEI